MPVFNTRVVTQQTHNPDLSLNAKTLLQTEGVFGMTIEGVPVPQDWYRLRNAYTGEDFNFPEDVGRMPKAVNITLPFGQDDFGKPCYTYCDTSTQRTASNPHSIPNEYHVYPRLNNPSFNSYVPQQNPYGADESVSEGATCAAPLQYYPQIGRYEFTSLCKGFDEVRNPTNAPATNDYRFDTKTVAIAAATPVGTILLLILGIWLLIRCYKAIKAEYNNERRVHPVVNIHRT